MTPWLGKWIALSPAVNSPMDPRPIYSVDLVAYFKLLDELFPTDSFNAPHRLEYGPGGIKLTIRWRNQEWPVTFFSTNSNEVLPGRSELLRIKSNIEKQLEPKQPP